MTHRIDFQNLTQFQSNQSFMEEVEKEYMRKCMGTLLEGLPLQENQLNLNFFQDDNNVPKKKKKKRKQNTVTRR